MEAQHSEYGNRTVDTTVDVTATTELPRRPLEAPRPPHVPDKPSLEGLEAKWSARWDEAGTYRFDRSAPRWRVFAIDTPPPTVSGSLHIGHMFSYTHTDAVARFRRMRGHDVFYPMGWDDNGLPTERRVQNYYGVRCDPGLRYDPSFTPPEKPGKETVSVSRPNFIELCDRLVVEDEKAFEHLWRTLGLSVDWSQTYATIDTTARRTSQHGFLRMLRDGSRVLGRGSDAVGRRLPDGGVPSRDGGTGAARGLPPGAFLPGRGRRRGRDRDDAPGAARRLRRSRGQPR